MNKPNTVPTPLCDKLLKGQGEDAFYSGISDLNSTNAIPIEDARSLEQRAVQAEEALRNITACIELNPGNTQMPLRIAREALGQGE